MKLSDLYKRALSLLYVPRCAACRDRLPPDGGALCEGCRLRYELQKSERCPFCGETLAHCLCPSEALRRAGVREVVKLFEYQKNAGEAVANRLVFTLKHRGSAPVVDFFAAELSARLARYQDASVRVKGNTVAYFLLSETDRTAAEAAFIRAAR